MMELRRILYLPIYPFFIAILPVLHFYLGNFRILRIGDTSRILLVYLVMTGVLLVVGRLIWKETYRAALVLSPALLVLFKGSHIGEAGSGLLLLSSFVLGVVLRRSSFHAPRISLPLNMAMLVFLALPVARIINAELKENTPQPTPMFETAIQLARPTNRPPPPDIYFLVVDGLGQPDFLEANYPVSRRVLRDDLAERGFQVLGRSLCSYPQTAHSVASTLNLGFIQDLLAIPDPENKDRRVLRQIIGENRVARSLREVGYLVKTFPSGYPVTQFSGPDQTYHARLNPSFLEYYVLDDGILPLLHRWVGRGPSDLSFSMRRHQLNFIFDSLPKARENLGESQSLFVFAHILAPHPPFVFGGEGEPIDPAVRFGYADGSHWFDIHDADATVYKARYSAQLRHITRRLAQVTDEILANSPRPPVIIIQGDHGPGSALVWEDPDATDHQERFGVYNAWHLPPDLDIGLGEDENTLNTFVLLFNAIFGADLELYPSHHWFATMSNPYMFYPVLEFGE